MVSRLWHWYEKKTNDVLFGCVSWSRATSRALISFLFFSDASFTLSYSSIIFLNGFDSAVGRALVRVCEDAAWSCERARQEPLTAAARKRYPHRTTEWSSLVHAIDANDNVEGADRNRLCPQLCRSVGCPFWVLHWLTFVPCNSAMLVDRLLSTSIVLAAFHKTASNRCMMRDLRTHHWRSGVGSCRKDTDKH